jgi:hypothetical protein
LDGHGISYELALNFSGFATLAACPEPAKGKFVFLKSKM